MIGLAEVYNSLSARDKDSAVSNLSPRATILANPAQLPSAPKPGVSTRALFTIAVWIDSATWAGWEKSMIGKRILIVEDDNATRRIMSHLFARKGWIVSEACTVAEAIARLDPPPDRTVLALTLPDDRGEALLRVIRESRIPIRVVLTVKLHEMVEEARGLGADVLLFHPFTADDLIRACQLDGDS